MYPFSFILTVYFLIREIVDGSLSRRRMGYREKHIWIMNNKHELIGLGMVSAFSLWIPFLNFLFFPFALVGATLIFCDIEYGDVKT